MARTKQVTIIQTPGGDPGQWDDFQVDGKTVEFEDTGAAVKALAVHEIEAFRIVRVAKAGKGKVNTIERYKAEYV